MWTFDEIVSKISSVSETETSSVDENKFSKERKKKKLILTGNVVAAEKYFEDEREVEISPNTELPSGEKN
ncbi:hypothetical protein CEXT_451421 [Caerostris extrusa]|uniref:Uncharacterized protein n=1 Tax=Caerostris extrusa TaxID=172846 RepID=A0AAV4Y8U4_CAEEX|nr:hypothetical protein CEXT_451421 [Caerostris extrusa]